MKDEALQEEAELEEIVRLEVDALSVSKDYLETANQSGRLFAPELFHEIDTYTSMQKQFRMMS